MAFLVRTFVLGLFAVALGSQKIMRHEGHDAHVALHLGSTGEMNFMHGQKTVDTCDDDYPLGKDASNDCVQDDEHQVKIILRRELCLEAAREANVTVDKTRFELDSTWYNHHPQGCFRTSCDAKAKTKEAVAAGDAHAGATGVCYFYNPVGCVPPCAGSGVTALEGVPVCLRRKLINGTAHTGTADKNMANGGCEHKYETIMSEDNCREAAICLGFAEAPLFRPDVEDQTWYDKYPLGCFIHSEDKKVYFNQPIPNHDTSDTANYPENPVGTPICKVASVTTFSSKAGTDTTAAATTAAATPAAATAAEATPAAATAAAATP